MDALADEVSVRALLPCPGGIFFMIGLVGFREFRCLGSRSHGRTFHRPFKLPGKAFTVRRMGKLGLNLRGIHIYSALDGTGGGWAFLS